MTDLQARILYLCVQQAKRQGGRVPPTKDLVKLLLQNNVVKKITPRAANYHLERLNLAYDCFSRQGRSLYLHPDLCTERESARYLLALQEKSSKDPDGRVLKKDLHDFLRSKYKMPPQVLEGIFSLARRAGYLAEIAASPEYIRFDSRAEKLAPYLRLLASEYPTEQVKQSA